MQEEVDSRTVALVITSAKLTGRVMMSAISRFLAHHAAKKQQKAEVIPHGKQSVKQLIGQNQGVTSIESNDPDIRAFEKVARKYGVDYAIKKVKEESGIQNLKVVATGGLGRMIADETATIDIYDSSLTLDGLLYIYEKNRK